MLSHAGAAAKQPSFGLGAERTLTLLVLASRVAYCLYSAAVVALNFSGYQRPALAAAALLLAIGVSAGLGARVWRERTIRAPVAILDTAVAVTVLLLVAAAIRPPGQLGSLNWALAYAVACAVWLAFGEGLWWRALLACCLGALYGVSVLHGVPAGTASIITIAVNAASLPMYFGIAAAVVWIMRRITAEMAAEQELEQRQRRDLAALAERGRLVREVHQSVLHTLDSIASSHDGWDVLRGRARAEVIALRAAFSGSAGPYASGRGAAAAGDLPATHGPGPGEAGGNSLRAHLARLVHGRAGLGWRIDLVDDEIDGEPPPAVTRALCAALAELTSGPVPGDGSTPIRVQARATSSQADVLIRIPAPEQAMTGPVTRSRSCLAGLGGTAGLEPALPGEVRVRLRVPT